MNFKKQLKKECETLDGDELKLLLNFIRFVRIKDKFIYDDFDRVLLRVI